MSRPLEWLGLVLAIVLFLWSLLVFIHTEILLLFPLTVGATEYGHWFALLCIILALAFARTTAIGGATGALLVLSAFAFSWPMLQAARLSQQITGQIKKAFPADLDAGSAFEFRKLWQGTEIVNTSPRKLIYAKHGEDSLSLFFFPAASKHPAPCIIVLHTGGWFSGNPQ